MFCDVQEQVVVSNVLCLQLFLCITACYYDTGHWFSALLHQRALALIKVHGLFVSVLFYCDRSFIDLDIDETIFKVIMCHLYHVVVAASVSAHGRTGVGNHLLL